MKKYNLDQKTILKTRSKIIFQLNRLMFLRETDKDSRTLKMLIDNVLKDL